MAVFFKGKGDDGTSTLKGGKRIYKDELVFDLIGTLDELTAHLGLAISFCEDATLKRDLKEIQTKLSGLMGYIAGGYSSSDENNMDLESMLAWIEERIDIYGSGQEKLKGFVFPGNNRLGAALDICRTVTRRSERKAVSIFRQDKQFDQKVLSVLNRLSSLLFVMRLFAER